MKKLDCVLKSLVHALGVFIYVLIVAWILFNAKTIFGEPQGFFIPVFLLLLFIVSATVTGLLVLGKPMYLYLNGFKKDAVILLLFTIGWLFVFLISVVVALLLN